MDATTLTCRIADRRKKLFDNPRWNGIDFVEVLPGQTALCVHFFGHVPQNVGRDNVRIEGGRRIRGIRAIDVKIDSAHDEQLDDCLHITLDRFGDFSTYRLCLVERAPEEPGEEAPRRRREDTECARECDEGCENDDDDDWVPLTGLDPRYSCIDFTFKIDCPSDLDCKTPPACPPPVLPAPDINYLAKDYASFRQLILDRLAVIMPDWQERHVPDLGITLVELLAYVGDYLSYYQDAVATEAYLDTARKRISVRRHVRLVDYRLHEGCNARAFVTVCTDGDLPDLGVQDFYFITGFADIKSPAGRVVKAEDLERAPYGSYEVFEPLAATPQQTFTFRAAHSEIRFYAWGDRECCLAKGATCATLLDEPQAPPPDGQRPPRVLALKKGDVLIFEEVIGPTTGDKADADPTRRHAVRLCQDPVQNEDGLLRRNVLEIEWGREDALPFSLCLSARLPAPDCCWIDNISVARGNVVLVDHGRTVGEPLGPVDTATVVGECACEGSVIETTTLPAPFTPALQGAPLTFAQDCAPCASATRLMTQDAREAKPRLWLQEFIGDAKTAAGPLWQARYDLLESGADDRAFVAEIDDDGDAHLRFGDGDLGAEPAAGTRFRATYRIGNGTDGNVGRETISYLVLRHETLSGVSVKPCNPLAARGGTAPEPIALAKLLAPFAFRSRHERAITAEDYAELAQRNAAIQRAAGELCWTGSWYEARVSIDPAHGEDAGRRLLHAIRRHLYRYRRMGHDLKVAPAQYVPLEVVIEVCVEPHYARGAVKARLLDVLSNRQLADGTLGFFHPDRLTFGQGVYVSQIIAAVTAVDGVETARLATLKRRDGIGTDALDTGVLPIGPFEVAQCDNDANFPEHGKLTLKVRGGR
jgi:hypothetical protein